MSELTVNQKERELRKSCKALMISGKAMISFGAWTVLRIVLMLFLGEHNIRTMVDSNPDLAEGVAELGANAVMMIFFAVIAIVCLIGFLINFLAGYGAYREGSGKKKGIVYIIITVIILGSAVAGIITTVRNGIQPPVIEEEDGFISDSGSFLLDITQVLICIDVLCSVYKARKLQKELGEEQAV